MRHSQLLMLIGIGSAVCLGVPSARAQGTVEVSGVPAGSLRDTLAAVTRDSGNAGFGALIGGLTALEVATAPLGAPGAGVVTRFGEAPPYPIQRLNYAPLLLGRAATSGRATAMFGLNIVTSTYDTISDRPLDALPVATFQGPAPIVTSSTLDLRVNTVVMTGFATVGVTDQLDVSLAVPVIGVTVAGSLVQEEAAIGTAVFPFDSTALGLGDLAVTGQYRIWAGANIPDGVAARVTLRVPTGSADELRGLDRWRTMFSGTVSRGLGRLSVHGTAGFEFWNRAIALANTLPPNLVETWLLKNQVQIGGGFELAATPVVTVSFEGLWRRVGQIGQLGLRTVTASVPAVGIESAQLLGVGPGGLTKSLLVPGISVNLQGRTMLTFRTIVSLSDSGLRDKFTPMVGVNWALCRDC